jgi:hypothetical protein
MCSTVSITDSIDRQESIFDLGRHAAVNWFPSIAKSHFTHSWRGISASRVIAP